MTSSLSGIVGMPKVVSDSKVIYKHHQIHFYVCGPTEEIVTGPQRIRKLMLIAICNYWEKGPDICWVWLIWDYFNILSFFPTLYIDSIDILLIVLFLLGVYIHHSWSFLREHREVTQGIRGHRKCFFKIYMHPVSAVWHMCTFVRMDWRGHSTCLHLPSNYEAKGVSNIFRHEPYYITLLYITQYQRPPLGRALNLWS